MWWFTHIYMPTKYKKRRIKKPKRVYKSNINKHNVTVKIDSGGSTPSISHMQPPPLNFTYINSTTRATFNEVLNDIF